MATTSQLKAPASALSLEQLAESEHRFRELVQALPDGIIVHRQGKIVFANPFSLALFAAASPEQLLDRDISDFIKPEYLAPIEHRIQKCYATGLASPPMESVLIGCDGSLVDIEAVAIPISWNGVPAIEVVLRDVRKRKRAEEAALESQKRLELAQKAGLRIGLWDWDKATQTVAWSEESYRQFGFTRETFSGRVEDAVMRLHPDDKDRVAESIEKVVSGKTHEYAEQYRTVWPDGTVCWIDAHGVMVRNGSEHMIGIGVDITEQKNIEQSLRHSEEKYRKLFENALYGVFLVKKDGTLLDVNPAMVTMLGYSSKEELLTRNLERDIYENSSERRAIIAKARPDMRVEGVEVNWRRKDEKIVRVRLSGAAIFDADGVVSHYEVIAEDITQRRRLEEQYRQAQKMEAIGALTGGISHDFNNHLAVILANSDLLLHKLPAGGEQHHVEAIAKAANSAAQLIRQLLAFSRKQVLYPTVLDINAVVAETGKILHRLIGEDVRIVTDLQTGLGSVRADRGQIEQILMNLATNARDAMPNGGALTIRTENAQLGPDDVACYSYVKPGAYIHVVVSDTGTGMSEEVRARVFEPFFTTKDKGRGTGLGLAMVYGIVKQSGGYIWVSSTPGAGATFNIYLPRVNEKAVEPTPKAKETPRYPRGTETILLLEDDDSLRQVTHELLAHSGYNVLDAARGDIAIDLATQYKDSIALVISDVVMPEMSGPSAVAKLRRAHPEMQVLYVSGYAEVPVVQKLIEEGAILMQKPLSRMSLLMKVDELLHRKRT